MLDRRCALLLCVLLLWALPAQAVDLARAQTRAVEAAQAYEGGDYETASRLYQAALDDGLDHAVIHYNLGNAHYKSGRLGRAIASYERAFRRAPRDGANRANLERARSQIRDEGLAPLSLPLFLRPVGWLYALLSLNEWATLLGIALLLLSAVGVVGHWRAEAPGLRRRLGIALAGVALVALLMTGLHYRAEEMREVAIVVAEEVMVRSGPGLDYNLAFKIHEGLRVFVSESREDWCQIHLGGELVGWVPRDRVEFL